MKREVKTVCIYPKTWLFHVQHDLKKASDRLVELYGDLDAVLVQLDQIGKGKSNEYVYATYLYNGIGNALDLLGKTRFMVNACYDRRGVSLEWLSGISDEETPEQEDPADE